MTDQKKIARVLLSVTDKTGIVEFARVLAATGAELISTGGTAQTLRSAGLQVKDVAEVTGFPEMLDGRVKTLHPVVHGGLLYRRDDPSHVAAVAEHGIQPIDMVIVNLYAFEETAAKPGVTRAELIENIDIGGPSMLRSAAKNYADVAVVTSPADYGALAEEMKQADGAISLRTRWSLAKAAFGVTAAYDMSIATTLEALPESQGAPVAQAEFPAVLRLVEPRMAVLRYGENPHQRAALYGNGSGRGIAGAKQLNGKELSFNNLVDLDACWALVRELPTPAVAIIKHTNPCGAATAASVVEAYEQALACDPVSAFGGVIGVNGVVDGQTAQQITKLFAEAVVAPEFTEEALEVLSTKKNLRVLQIQDSSESFALKSISGGLLVQDADAGEATESDWKTATEREATSAEMRALRFAWGVCKHVKSNAIVYARASEAGGQTVGIGAGQMSRVDAAKFGAMKARLTLTGTVAASDAFFPFADGLESVAAAGATAVIQPGGSVRDAEVIEAANRLGVAMILTGRRHFRHG